MISASLAQIGEFSFILASLGLALGVLPNEGRDLIIAGAIISILLNPLLFAWLDRYYAWRENANSRPDEASPETSDEKAEAKKEATPTREPIPATTLTNHVVLIGHGRVGRFVSKSLIEKGIPVYIIEDDAEDAADLTAHGVQALHGNAADPHVIKSANLDEARCMLVAIPDAFEGGQVVEQARATNPTLRIVARAHSEAEIDHLAKHGADFVVMGEHEIGKAMLSELSDDERPISDAVTGMATMGPIRGR
jgi:CPA2 family monovalent cation:H+ antiporter-2